LFVFSITCNVSIFACWQAAVMLFNDEQDRRNIRLMGLV